MNKKVETSVTKPKPKYNPATYQFPFLNKLIKAKVPATFVFTNGTKRKVDTIIGYDQFHIVIKEGELETLLFKGDIRAITPIGS